MLLASGDFFPHAFQGQQLTSNVQLIHKQHDGLWLREGAPDTNLSASTQEAENPGSQGNAMLS